MDPDRKQQDAQDIPDTAPLDPDEQELVTQPLADEDDDQVDVIDGELDKKTDREEEAH